MPISTRNTSGLAFHAEGARDDEKALEYLWLAGLRARRSSASGSLFLIFRAGDAVHRTYRSPRRMRRLVDFVLMACAQLLQIGEFSKMKPYLAARPGTCPSTESARTGSCAAYCNMGTVSWFEGRYADSRAECERALEIGESLGNLPMIFAAKFMLAIARFGDRRT